MLADTILAVRGVHTREKIFVVTNYEPAMEIAAKNGWEILREEQQISESASVDFASRLCAERGVTALLRLPLDLPLVQSGDIDELLATECAPPQPSWSPRAMVPAQTPFYVRRPLSSHRILGRIVSPSIAPKPKKSAQELSSAETRDSKWMSMMKPICASCLRHDLTQTATGRWLEESGVAARFKIRALATEAPG